MPPVLNIKPAFLEAVKSVRANLESISKLKFQYLGTDSRRITELNRYAMLLNKYGVSVQNIAAQTRASQKSSDYMIGSIARLGAVMGKTAEETADMVEELEKGEKNYKSLGAAIKDNMQSLGMWQKAVVWSKHPIAALGQGMLALKDNWFSWMKKGVVGGLDLLSGGVRSVRNTFAGLLGFMAGFGVASTEAFSFRGMIKEAVEYESQLFKLSARFGSSMGHKMFDFMRFTRTSTAVSRDEMTGYMDTVAKYALAPSEHTMRVIQGLSFTVGKSFQEVQGLYEDIINPTVPFDPFKLQQMLDSRYSPKAIAELQNRIITMGGLSPQARSKVFEDFFSNTANQSVKFASTTEGMLMRLDSTIKTIAQDISQGFWGFFKGSLGDVLNWFNNKNNRSTIVAWGQSIGRLFSDVGRIVASFFKTLFSFKGTSILSKTGVEDFYKNFVAPTLIRVQIGAIKFAEIIRNFFTGGGVDRFLKTVGNIVTVLGNLVAFTASHWKEILGIWAVWKFVDISSKFGASGGAAGKIGQAGAILGVGVLAEQFMMLGIEYFKDQKRERTTKNIAAMEEYIQKQAGYSHGVEKLNNNSFQQKLFKDMATSSSESENVERVEIGAIKLAQMLGLKDESRQTYVQDFLKNYAGYASKTSPSWGSSLWMGGSQTMALSKANELSNKGAFASQEAELGAGTNVVDVPHTPINLSLPSIPTSVVPNYGGGDTLHIAGNIYIMADSSITVKKLHKLLSDEGHRKGVR